MWAVGNSLDKLRHTSSVAYSAELVLLNKQQISSGRGYLDCYRTVSSLAGSGAEPQLKSNLVHFHLTAKQS